MKNAVGYVRVSTAEQAKKGISIKNQKLRIRRYAEDNDLLINEICEDVGISGSKIENRPGLKELMDIINAKKAEAVVSYKLDRLFRNASDAINTLNWLKKKRVAFHSITEKIDTTTPLGKFFVGITALYAEMERDVLSERIRDNLKMKKLRGEKTGGHVPYGYDSYIKEYVKRDYKTVPLYALKENKQEQRRIRKMKKLRNQGLSYRAISDELNRLRYKTKTGKKWTAMTIKRTIDATQVKVTSKDSKT
jgi:site-specific DNA recombinase